MKNDLKDKYKSTLRNQLKVKYQMSLKYTSAMKYQQNKEVLEAKYIQKLKETLRIKYQESLKTSARENYHLKKSQKTFQFVLNEFRRSLCLGITLDCICCERVLFENGVTQLSEKTLANLDADVITKSINPPNLGGPNFICHSCYQCLREGELPGLSAMNNLMIEPIPDQLKLSDFEMQLIAKDLLFMKVFSLPKSRMPAIRDKVINVPLTNVDIDRTTKLLPRSVDDSLLVNVQLKRSKELKNDHSQAFVRPNMLIEALTYLKASGNPIYSDVVVNESIQVNDENESPNIDVPNEADENNENTPPVETDVGLDICFIPQNSAAHLISNNGTLHKVLSDTIVVAPGENKFPINWLSNKDFEAKSFPCLFQSGRNTLNEKRVKQISSQQYFNQRIMNKNIRYAKDSAYLFAAQQRVEREQLERQCDVLIR